MSVSRPFRRTCRPFVDGHYNTSQGSDYIKDGRFAQAPEHYIRAFLLLQKDLQTLFEFIEPADNNLSAYSYRTHELLLRACVEVEANCKAILTENGYRKPTDLNMNDYKKLNATHRLSSFEVIFPVWQGAHQVRRPFDAWASGQSLPWYVAYNDTKHDRHSVFHRATFEQTIDAVAGLLVVLSAQFFTNDFAPVDFLRTRSYDGREIGIGGYFQVRFPTDWPVADRYDFVWSVTRNEAEPYDLLAFS